MASLLPGHHDVLTVNVGVNTKISGSPGNMTLVDAGRSINAREDS